jgi:RNA polymerase sigma-70 factor (ECF subfamily)
VAESRGGQRVQDRIGDVFADEGPRLWRAIFAFTGDRELTSDVVAEAFTQAIERGDAVRSPDRWVWRAAFRIAAGELKARRRGGGEMPERSYEMTESNADLLAALQAVSPKQRAALILHYYADLPVRQIAETLGSSGATIRVHLSQGRKRLRTLLEETG